MIRIVPPAQRRKGVRWVKLQQETDRCAAETAAGAQCVRVWGGTGENGDHVEIDGERVYLCTPHLRAHLRGQR